MQEATRQRVARAAGQGSAAKSKVLLAAKTKDTSGARRALRARVTEKVAVATAAATRSGTRPRTLPRRPNRMETIPESGDEGSRGDFDSARSGAEANKLADQEVQEKPLVLLKDSESAYVPM